MDTEQVAAVGRWPQAVVGKQAEPVTTARISSIK